MTTAEIKTELKRLGLFRPGLTFQQLVEILEMHRRKASRPARLTQACEDASVAKSFHVRRKLAEIDRTGGKGRGGGIETLDMDTYGDQDGRLDVTSGLCDVHAVHEESKA